MARINENDKKVWLEGQNVHTFTLLPTNIKVSTLILIICVNISQ